ncbi:MULTISPECIES: iron-containing alcohol dehydrogenase family protein [unclassified Nocardioides]|uniref:iron-containing alcohol dehydrogenase family protein n=1 Tax=unclassified Nocardioides TaxID=2615069 RepID=UPI00117155C2|nr:MULTISPECIES: iron-containing alcohol dehydrogenase [unclassified Nocardioides]TQK69064.1 alcohol dehydrogenase/alcohol dehydrogenase [Nocardioides sp. SLBN-35]WGY01628.1 iron-containing alcohol dehydrogenase [Nocardioides sp. QY071]
MSTAFPRFAVRTEVVTGLGSLAHLDALVAGFGHREVAVVADTALEPAGVLARVLGHAPEAIVVSQTLVDPDPDIEVVEQAAAQARAAGARCVLAIGGGSALGVGKAVGIRLTNDQRIDAYEGRDKVGEQPAPTIAVPTTAGSGSEVSNALVLHEAGRDNEIVVRGELCAPRAAVLDATVLRTLPRTPLVHSALDALSHALEALWARGASYFTTATAIPAARSIIELLPAAATGADDGSSAAGANDVVLQELLEASCAANMACGNSGLALVHALSSSPSVRVPHGLQNAVLLPHVARFNADVLAPEARALLPLVEHLYDELRLVASFAALDARSGAGTVDGWRMLEASARNPFRANNLRPTTDADLVDLLRAAGATFPEESR